MENEWANDQSTWFTCNPFTFSLNIFWIDGLDLTRVSIRLFENNERKKKKRMKWNEWNEWINEHNEKTKEKKRYKSSKTLVRKTWQEMFPFMPVRSFVRLFPSHCCCCCGIFIRFWHAHYLKRKSLTELEFWIIAFECYVDLFFGCGRGTTKGYWRQWRWTTTHTESRIRTQNMILNSQNWFFFFWFFGLFIHSFKLYHRSLVVSIHFTLNYHRHLAPIISFHSGEILVPIGFFSLDQFFIQSILSFCMCLLCIHLSMEHLPKKTGKNPNTQSIQ